MAKIRIRGGLSIKVFEGGEWVWVRLGGPQARFATKVKNAIRSHETIAPVTKRYLLRLLRLDLRPPNVSKIKALLENNEELARIEGLLKRREVLMKEIWRRRTIVVPYLRKLLWRKLSEENIERVKRILANPQEEKQLARRLILRYSRGE